MSGIQSRPELNGQRGVCMQYDEKKGRWEVRLDAGEVISVKESSLTTTTAPSKSSTAVPCHDPITKPKRKSATPTSGAAVRVSGIQSRPELNGQRGVCMQYDEKKGRWEVRLDGGEVISVKESSLTTTMAPPTSALIEAVENGHVELVKSMLAAGADANATNSKGVPALVQATCYGAHAAMAHALVGAQADVNATDVSGATALMGAARSGWHEVMYDLIQHKANVHAQSHGTALHKAAPTTYRSVFSLSVHPLECTVHPA